MQNSLEAPAEGVRPRRGPGLARAAPACISALVLAGVAAICWVAIGRDRSVPVERRGELWYPRAEGYAGDASCRKCHAGVADLHEVSAHAARVRPVRPGTPLGSYVNGQEVPDTTTGAIYQVRYHEGRNELLLRAGPISVTAPIQWEFGSGRRARGYILRTDDGEYVDCRLNWYQATQGWDFASGQDRLNRILVENPLGRPLPPAEVARCFGCHSTEIYATGATPQGVPAEKLEFKFDRGKTGLGCETCHGPRAEHVAAFESGKPQPRAERMTAVQMNELCGRCHSKANIDPEHDVLARFQPWGLERSRCFTESNGRLSCASCHDPHDNVQTDHASYDARCISCHSPAGRKEKLASLFCPVNRSGKCVSCHMPEDAKGMKHVTLTDHWIRVVRKKDGSALAAAAAAHGTAEQETR